MIQILFTLIGSQTQHDSSNIDDHSQARTNTWTMVWGITPQPQLKSCTNILTLE